MPPSPALRCSPGRELRVEGHKRGRSLEGGLVFREKDDDLTLFKEMQTRERDSFLLQSDDDFEDSFSSKLRHFSDFKLGIAIPVKGQSSDLLNAEGEKNDYDWLLTPPDTPLFRSLDDETPPVTLPRRGRPRSQPISISRSSTMEKSYRSSRGSASPSRSSASPRSSSSFSQSRGRPSSARPASPSPSGQHATPPNRTSPPPSKHSTPGPRSSTPMSRRMSSGPGAAVGPSVRGTSPVKISRGNSASPKIRSWQANIPGFSTEAPPNLRTSLTDRPASYVRGTSPASRNSQDSSSNFGRQSMSPTGSRSITSYSQDRDRFSSHSKGSVESSGDDDIDSLQSVYVGSLDRSTLKKVGAFPSKKSFASSRKRVVSSTSAPKRYFDSALRQMDHRKAPQNMFRPLLSSVPSSMFYAGNSGSVQRSLVSRNSSVTTSSNTSSDHGMGIALDMEGSDDHRDGMACESAQGVYSGVEQEIFDLDKVDTANEDLESESYTDNQLVNMQVDEFRKGPAVESGPLNVKDRVHGSVLVEVTATSEVSRSNVDRHGIDDLENLVACSICGCEYDMSDCSEGDEEICPECRRKGKILDMAVTESEPVITETMFTQSVGTLEEHKHLDKLNALTALSESRRFSHADEQIVLQEDNHEQQIVFPPENYLMDADKHQLAVEECISATVGSELLDAMSENQMPSQSNKLAKADVSEASGISLLLTRSSSIKGPVIQGRSFTVSAIPRDDLSYARDSTNSMRSSYGRDNVSRSSSIDFGSRRTDHLGHFHLHSLKSDIDSHRHDIRSQSMGSSISGASENAQQGCCVTASVLGDFENSVDNEKDNAMEGIVPSLEQVHCPKSSLSKKMPSASMSQLSDLTTRVGLEDDDAACDRLDESDVCEDASCQANLVKEASKPALESSNGEVPGLVNQGVGIPGFSEVLADSSVATTSEMETFNCQGSILSDDDDVSPKYIAFNKSPGPSDAEMTAFVPELSGSDPPNDILEESTIMVETRAGSKARSLTLEEATDTILFCSSIVHDLAYKAATIAIAKEDGGPLEESHPTVTILGKSTPDMKDPPRRGRIVSKRALKTQKARLRQVETEKTPPTFKTENDENIDESLTRNIGLPSKGDSEKPPKLESKCNCTIM